MKILSSQFKKVLKQLEEDGYEWDYENIYSETRKGFFSKIIIINRIPVLIKIN